MNKLISIITVYFGLMIMVGCQKAASPIVDSQLKQEVMSDNSQKVILITLDGLRWQELFGGTDTALVDSEYTKHKELIDSLYSASTSTESREKLMPFFWNTIAKEGQIYGNRELGNNVNVSNTHWFSYPGYSEILTGYADNERVDSNDKFNNPNTTILEVANKSKQYAGKVGAFASWDGFPFIINEERAGLYVNAGYRNAIGSDLTDKEKYLNELQQQAVQPWPTVRQDVFTHNYALEFMKKNQPNLMYISYGETDDFAHDGDYEHYLLAANNTDNMIKELWDYCQNNNFYKNNTVFIITTDHGRGTTPIEEWKSHGQNLKYQGETYNIDGSNQTWLAVIGNNIPAKGLVATEMQLYSNQIYATISQLLGLDIPENSKANPEALPIF